MMSHSVLSSAVINLVKQIKKNNLDEEHYSVEDIPCFKVRNNIQWFELVLMW